MKTSWLTVLFSLLVALGALIPLWPLSLIGVVGMALIGRWFFAVVLGLLLDLFWGPPQGALHMLYAPFTLAAIAVALVRAVLLGRVRQRARDTL